MANNVRFVLSSNPANLARAIAGKRSVTVEAEYGKGCVPGTELTMAHHGPRAGQPAPCSYPNGCVSTVEVVGLSHSDLDSLGGCAAVIDEKPEADSFWRLAEFVDLNGQHKINKSGASEEDIRRYFAFVAWEEKNKVFPSRDGSVSDVTEHVLTAVGVLKKILKDDPELLKIGDEYRANEVKLNNESFIDSRGGVALRIHPDFVNHLYGTPEGEDVKAIVRFSPVGRTITVSFADPPTGKNAREILQGLFGEKAGGHNSIAGSPREQKMTLEDVLATYNATIEAVK